MSVTILILLCSLFSSLLYILQLRTQNLEDARKITMYEGQLIHYRDQNATLARQIELHELFQQSFGNYYFIRLLCTQLFLKKMFISGNLSLGSLNLTGSAQRAEEPNNAQPYVSSNPNGKLAEMVQMSGERHPQRQNITPQNGNINISIHSIWRIYV